MAYTVTGDDVKAILETSMTAQDIAPFIKAANIVVTDRLGGAGYGDAHLKEIERWLAAHLTAIRERLFKSEKTGDATGTLFGEAGLGLDFTPYGQQVKLLDTSGLLATLGLKRATLETIDFISED